MRQEVLSFLANLPKKEELQFNKALSLFGKTPNHPPGQFRFLNNAGYSRVNLKNLLYDLKKAHNITEAHIRSEKNKIVRLKAKPKEVTLETLDSLETKVLIDWLAAKEVKIPNASEDYQELKSFIKDQDIETASQSKEDLLEAFNKWLPVFVKELAINILSTPKELENSNNEDLEDVKAQEAKADVFVKAPDQVKETVKLRDEFPFLNDLETCPEEFHILVGHKFAYYEKYVAANKALLVLVDTEAEGDKAPESMTPEQITALALEAVENFQLNQDIYKELNHYKETGKVLGEHPIFKERVLRASVEKLNPGTCAKRIGNLENYIRRDRNHAKKAKDEAEKEKFLNKVKDWELELKMIKTKFNLE